MNSKSPIDCIKGGQYVATITASSDGTPNFTYPKTIWDIDKIKHILKYVHPEFSMGDTVTIVISNINPNLAAIPNSNEHYDIHLKG